METTITCASNPDYSFVIQNVEDGARITLLNGDYTFDVSRDEIRKILDAIAKVENRNAAFVYAVERFDVRVAIDSDTYSGKYRGIWFDVENVPCPCGDDECDGSVVFHVEDTSTLIAALSFSL